MCSSLKSTEVRNHTSTSLVSPSLTPSVTREDRRRTLRHSCVSKTPTDRTPRRRPSSTLPSPPTSLRGYRDDESRRRVRGDWDATPRVLGGGTCPRLPLQIFWVDRSNEKDTLHSTSRDGLSFPSSVDPGHHRERYGSRDDTYSVNG